MRVSGGMLLKPFRSMQAGGGDSARGARGAFLQIFSSALTRKNVAYRLLTLDEGFYPTAFPRTGPGQSLDVGKECSKPPNTGSAHIIPNDGPAVALGKHVR